MGIKVIERNLSFWDRTYVPAVFKGLRITAGHFFRNMLIHTLHLLGLARHLRGAETYQYPEERRPLSPRLRTLHRLTRREDDSPRCVACMMCETVGPARCIYIVAASTRIPSSKSTLPALTSIWDSAFSAAIVSRPVPRMPFEWTRESWSSRPTPGRDGV